MRHKNINKVTHQWLAKRIQASDILVDATAGNGHDTVFLASLGKHVFAFDVSELAYQRTKEKIMHLDNVTLIHDSHTQIKKYITTPIDGVMFNCGYLPQSDHSSVTEATTTLLALDHLRDLLAKDGWICITVYTGHSQGEIEAIEVKSWLDRHAKIIRSYTYEGVNNTPIAYLATLA